MSMDSQRLPTAQLSNWADLIVDAVAEDLGPTDAWPVAEGYHNSLALATIDAIQSLGVRYAGVRRVVGRYQRFREDAGADAGTDGASDLRRTFDDLGGISGWALHIGNGQRVFARMDAPLKAEVIRDAADLLVSLDLDTAASIRAMSDTERAELKREWLGLKSQGSGISFRYLLMLVGEEGVKPDRMILRYLSSRIPGQPTLSLPDAVEVLRLAAGRVGVSLTGLDHAIWQYQRRFPLASPGEARVLPTSGTFEVFEEPNAGFSWRLLSDASQPLATGASYSTQDEATQSVIAVRRAASDARILGPQGLL